VIYLKVIMLLCFQGTTRCIEYEAIAILGEIQANGRLEEGTGWQTERQRLLHHVNDLCCNIFMVFNFSNGGIR
jgi:hypothetical protein